ncbi:GNAT family N-acetyltransferase [Pseudoduganella sp. SL102]|uniref:GNAT family N-acetyltransferase n=1 Tax=Pseudoduganella sp. SL102 TaxID=2995154 RepID=UPI00248CD016|nr:GNAT family N-acetyltransferase [Pseudoduganella sp. SL102]WBS05526.1 GNAT family N-acetyltransferase [Pseudoduganella sp. SL102]
MIETRPARLEERLIVGNLMELYQHDFSEIDGTELDEHGRYGYHDLDCFWIKPDWAAYVVAVDGKWAGFALTNDEVYVQGNTRAIVEFFIVRKYRGRGIGGLAAQAIMDQTPARWEIRVLEQNGAALRFWAKLLDKLWPDQHNKAGLANDDWHGPVFSVDTRAGRR